MNEQGTLEGRVNSNNHLYLVMGPTCSGKTSITDSAVKILGPTAKKEKKYTDRRLRPEEIDADGNVLPNADVLPFPKKDYGIFKGGKSRKDVLLSYDFEGHEYGIPKSLVDDVERGLDVFLVTGDINQKQKIIEVLPESARNKVVPVMIISDADRIRERLEQRIVAAEILRRTEIVKRQIAEYKERAEEFEYIIFNDVEQKNDETARISTYHNLALTRLVPIVRFRSSHPQGRDYVSHLIYNLFNGAELNSLLNNINSRMPVTVKFSEDRIRRANLSWDVAQRLPVEIMGINIAHGRGILVFGRYDTWERRNDILRYVEAQAGESARYISADPDYKRVSAFGLLKAVNTETGQAVPEGSGISEGVHDGAVFSLTDFAGKLMPNDTKTPALVFAFLKDPEKLRLVPVSEEEYHALRYGEHSRYITYTPLNKGINGFHSDTKTQ